MEGDTNPHELLSALDEHHVAGKQLHVSTGAAHTTLVISRENLHDQEKVLGALKTRFGDRIAFAHGLGAVSAIGAGINASYANVRTGLAALREAGIEPRGMSTSSFRITWMVPAGGVVASVRALHAFHRSTRTVGALRGGLGIRGWGFGIRGWGFGLGSVLTPATIAPACPASRPQSERNPSSLRVRIPRRLCGSASRQQVCRRRVQRPTASTTATSDTRQDPPSASQSARGQTAYRSD